MICPLSFLFRLSPSYARFQNSIRKILRIVSIILGFLGKSVGAIVWLCSNMAKNTGHHPHFLVSTPREYVHYRPHNIEIQQFS